MLRKLTDRGLIQAVQDKSDRRSSFLYVTEKGKDLDQKHKKYDSDNIEVYLDLLRAKYSDDEIQFAYQVLSSWVDFFLEQSLQWHINSDYAIETFWVNVSIFLPVWAIDLPNNFPLL